MDFDLNFSDTVVQAAIIAGTSAVVSAFIALGAALINLWAGVIHRRFDKKARIQEQEMERKRQKAHEILDALAEHLATVSGYVRSTEHFKAGVRGFLPFLEKMPDTTGRYDLLYETQEQGGFIGLWDLPQYSAVQSSQKAAIDWFAYQLPVLLLWLSPKVGEVKTKLKALEANYNEVYKKLVAETQAFETMNQTLLTFAKDKDLLRNAATPLLNAKQHEKQIEQIIVETEKVHALLVEYLR